MKKYYTAILAVSLIGVIVFAILGAKSLLPVAVAVTLGAICLVFLLFGILGVIVYKTERFYFKNGEYYCKKAFKKPQTARLSEIFRVEIKGRKSAFSNVQITFFGKDGEKLIDFFADGWIFKNNIFMTSLSDNRIKVTDLTGGEANSLSNNSSK